MSEPEAGDDPEGVQLVTDAEATCPYCGETVTIGLDPGSGTSQDYEQDCEVCCRPWRVHLRYDENGSPVVWLEPES